MTTNFDPQEAERLVERLENTATQGCTSDDIDRNLDDAIDMLRAAIEAVQELEALTHRMDTNLNFGNLYAEASERLAAAEKVIEAARYALRAWQAMPDALLTDKDPRYNWWMQTHAERQALAQALQEYDEPKDNVTTTNQPRPQGWVDAHISPQALQEYDGKGERV